MKATATIAALTLGLASVGMAQAADLQDYTFSSTNQAYPVDTAHSTRSRADVLNELHLAEAQGQVALAGEQANLNYPQLQEGTAKTRAQVQSELASARNEGQVFMSTNSDAYPL